MKKVTKGKEHYSYQIVLRPESEGGYTVTVPSLPGCITYGRTVEEARTMAKDAVRGYLKSLQKDGQRIPKEDQGNIFASISLAF